MKKILSVSAAFLLGTCLAPASQPGSFYRNLSVSGPVQLDVTSDRGGMVITSGSDATVHVHAILKPLAGKLGSSLAKANIRALEQNPPVEQVGNRIRVGYVTDPALLQGVSVRFEIQTPHTTQVHAHTTSGGIRIDGLSAPADTQTSSGRTEISNLAADVNVIGHSGAILIRNTGGSVFTRNHSGGIQLIDVHGPVDTRTVSGRTEISEVSGDVRSTTHSGSIRVDNARGGFTAHNTSGNIDAFQLAGPVNAETRSGAIRIGQTTPAPIRALTHSGSIHVELATRGSYSIDAPSMSGKVTSTAPNAITQIAENHRLKGQIAGGGPLVDLDTHSSQINIE